MTDQHLKTLRKYYDPATLRQWLADYGHITTGKRGKQVARWRRMLATLEGARVEKVEMSNSPPDRLLREEKPLATRKI